MNFPSDLLAHILSQTVQAIDDIQADPVGFLLRMVEALKAGFQGFLDNSLDYLMQGLVAWLFRGLAQLGITIPTEISFGSILGLVLEVLGLTTDFIWRKLEEHTGKDQVEAIREGMATLARGVGLRPGRLRTAASSRSGSSSSTSSARCGARSSRWRPNGP